LRRCLESLEKSQGRETLQIVVVDNGSSDGSAQLDADFPQTQFIRLPKNFGLTKAMNLGWRAADAEYVFFLHDDTEVDPGAAIRLAGTLDANPDASAACPLLVDDAGQPAPKLGALPPTGEWLTAEPSGSQPEPVVYPRGAAPWQHGLLGPGARRFSARPRGLHGKVPGVRGRSAGAAGRRLWPACVAALG
jgi:hypothetical protein